MNTPLSVQANRREFLQGVGGLTLVIGSTGLITACSTEEAEQIAQSEGTDLTANIWVTIGSDESIEIVGQQIHLLRRRCDVRRVRAHLHTVRNEPVTYEVAPLPVLEHFVVG